MTALLRRSKHVMVGFGDFVSDMASDSFPSKIKNYLPALLRRSKHVMVGFGDFVSDMASDSFPSKIKNYLLTQTHPTPSEISM